MKLINKDINKYFHMIPLWKSPIKLPVELPVELPVLPVHSNSPHRHRTCGHRTDAENSNSPHRHITFFIFLNYSSALKFMFLNCGIYCEVFMYNKSVLNHLHSKKS